MAELTLNSLGVLLYSSYSETEIEATNGPNAQSMTTLCVRACQNGLIQCHGKSNATGD